MHCSLIALQNGRTFANLSELLKALLSARCKYRLYTRNSVFVIISDTARLWQSSRLSQYISYLGNSAYPLTKRIVGKTLGFSTVIANIWLPSKWAKLVDSSHILSISVFAKKISNNSCGNRLLSKAGAGSFHTFNSCHTELLMCYRAINVFPIGCFTPFHDLETK